MSALAPKDVNAPVGAAADTKPDVKSMEYHRQMLQSKMAQEKYERPSTAAHTQQGLTTLPYNRSQQYISPSDNIMSPCTAKLTALRNKQIGK